jgi:hypothetical protein
MHARFGVGLAVGALLVAAMTPVAYAGPQGADRPFKGVASGVALYGAAGGGTNGLENVFGCDEGAGTPAEEFLQVTTFTSADGTASHLGKVHLEFAHCPGFDGPVDGQVGIVAANGDVLYGEYEGMGEQGIFVTFNPETNARESCELLNDVPCESSGRFADASGTAWLTADAVPGDEEDLFVPWPWWGDWAGSLSY